MIKLLLLIPIFISLLVFIQVVTEVKIQRKQGKIIKKFNGEIQKISMFKRLFIMFPRQLVIDIFERDPNDFDYYGLHMFCGMQGSGKTVSVVQFLKRLKKMYPMLQIYTNMGYDEQDGKITHWKQIVERSNGTKGIVEVIDEIQAWFSSNQSKDFPPEMLAEVSQQRKQRKMLIGTAQVFGRIGKPIREQTTFVYIPRTFFGCLTVVRRTRPELYNEQTQKFDKFEKTYFYVHDEIIRNAFNTYERIKDYKDIGFKTDQTRISAN